MAYAFVQGRWISCISEYYLQFKGHAERELLLATAESRKRQQNHSKEGSITAKRLAELLADASAHEVLLTQRLQDVEAQDVFAQMGGGPGNESREKRLEEQDVQDLATRANPRGSKILSISSGHGLSRATMQQRLTVVRLYHDYLIEKQIRPDNPVGRGKYVVGKGVSTSQRGLLASQHKLPWIPSDSEWLEVLRVLKGEKLRNQVMLLLAYDGALRREELVRLEIADFDFAYRQIRIRAEHAKNGSARVVGYSRVTSHFLEAYLQKRRQLSAERGALFLSESRRNPGSPLSLILWSKVIERIADQAGLPRFTTHTPRHLRLTHLARSQMDLHQIATYAGHKSLQTTMLYLHASSVELTEAVRKSLAGFEQWMARILEGALT